nr:ribonuclease H-like domain-containing protein [Tanacetum cinerariifolium]
MSEHNSPINTDNDDEVHDPVTRISKLDISDPLQLHPNDTTALTVVSIKLKRTKNYQVWSCAMLLDLEGKNKICFIDGFCKRSNTDEVLGKQWDMVNAIILDEQMATLISLIKDNKVGKNTQANMEGHPNRTEAYISKIGNLRLSNGLTLYDVKVIPEYCVTLIYVHKLVKENKFIVAFDENKCYFLNKDLNLKMFWELVNSVKDCTNIMTK